MNCNIGIKLEWPFQKRQMNKDVIETRIRKALGGDDADQIYVNRMIYEVKNRINETIHDIIKMIQEDGKYITKEALLDSIRSKKIQ